MLETIYFKNSVVEILVVEQFNFSKNKKLTWHWSCVTQIKIDFLIYLLRKFELWLRYTRKCICKDCQLVKKFLKFILIPTIFLPKNASQTIPIIENWMIRIFIDE